MTFNASLVREMFGIATVSSLIESGKLDDERYTTVRGELPMGYPPS